MQHHGGNVTENGGWVTTRQAARALGVIPRQVRNYIAAGDLEGRKEGKGVKERWIVSISSVETLRQKRHSEGKIPGQYRDVAGDAEDVGQGAGENVALIRGLAARLEDVQYELGRAEARLELTTQAESTLREALERERERADRLEAELREVQNPTPEPRDGPGTASEGKDRGEVTPEPQESVQRRSWLYRFFFGP
jgi:microcompartment protein CcmK/EutM